MSYSKPIQMLVDEHEVIKSVLEAVEAVARRGDGGQFPQDFYEQAFDFFPAFADKCHHAKEEVHLFPLLEARGVPREGGPIGCMLTEHEEGRGHVAAVREALRRTRQGDRQARATVRREALAYVELLRHHILKENEILFVVGDQRMTAKDKEELFKKFQCAEHSVLPPGSHERYVALAKELQVLSAEC
jgi:hemerythrin-like domain-containing protein